MSRPFAPVSRKYIGQHFKYKPETSAVITALIAKILVDHPSELIIVLILIRRELRIIKEGKIPVSFSSAESHRAERLLGPISNSAVWDISTAGKASNPRYHGRWHTRRYD